jgi:DNA-binding winged helix-turn-helix (wHTH) protein
VTAIYRFGRFALNPATRQLLVDEGPVLLGARAFDVLLALIERRDRLVTKNELLELVWPGVVVEENNLMVQVSALRKLLGADAIATIAGRGYRFSLTITQEALSVTPSPRDKLRPPANETTPSIAVLPFVNLSHDEENAVQAGRSASRDRNTRPSQCRPSFRLVPPAQGRDWPSG